MAATVRKVTYFALKVSDVPGEGARLLRQLKKHKVDLIALSAFPRGRGTQVDLIPQDVDRLLALEEKLEWQLSEQKTGFLIQGRNEAGALLPAFRALGTAGINVTAIDAVASSPKRFGAILWVRPADVARAAKLLGAV